MLYGLYFETDKSKHVYVYFCWALFYLSMNGFKKYRQSRMQQMSNWFMGPSGNCKFKLEITI